MVNGGEERDFPVQGHYMKKGTFLCIKFLPVQHELKVNSGIKLFFFSCFSCIPYTTKISLDKNFAKPSYLYITKIFGEINFRICGKGHHILNVIINTGQKICGIKFSPIRADGEIGETFLLAKISVYTVCEDFWPSNSLGQKH